MVYKTDNYQAARSIPRTYSNLAPTNNHIQSVATDIRAHAQEFICGNADPMLEKALRFRF